MDLFETKEQPGRTGRASRDYVNSLARGLGVIRAFDSSQPEMTLSEISFRAGINRAAARRLLLTLVHEGYAETDGKYFRLRPTILSLGLSAVSSMSLPRIAQPLIEDLATAFKEICLVAVLDGDWVVYVNKSQPQRLVGINLDIGSRLPAFCMSTGRVLLASLSDPELDEWLARLRPRRFTRSTIVSKVVLHEAIVRARADGYAIMGEEYEIGLGSLAVPIRDRSGATVAALNVCCPMPRVSLTRMRRDFLGPAREAAATIGELLPVGYHRAAPALS